MGEMEKNNLFNLFLKNTKQKLNSEKPKWLVIGNESSDLDSVVCSLTYSYYKQIKLCDAYCVLPVISISKANITLKTDVLMWIKKFNIDHFTDFIYMEEIISLLNDKKFCANLKISLVDHHKPMHTILTNYIIEVIDHRKLIYQYSPNQLQIINVKLVGSCSTLVVQYIIDDENFPDRKILLKLLYGVILLDTDCLSISSGRTTENDIHTIEIIEKILDITFTDRTEIYNSLVIAKSDISGLTFFEKIHRDLKTIEVEWKYSNLKIAIPTLIETDVQDILSLDDIKSQLHAILIELNVTMLIILTCIRSTIPRRGYIIFSQNIELSEKISQYLLSESKLQLEKYEFNQHADIIAFVENSLKTSRKLFIPIIENYFIKESKIQCQRQLNNCNIHLSFDEIDNNIVDDFEIEGAPYTLSTPLRSCSGSPDTRNSDMSLPSLNNRRTLALVDQKRQKHNVDMEVLQNENDEENNKLTEDDVSPLAYTPENSDEDDSDLNSDHVRDILSMNYENIVKQIENKQNKLSEISSDVSSHTSPESFKKDIFHSPIISKSNSKESTTDLWNNEFFSLACKVNKKRQKLKTSHLDEHIKTDEQNIRFNMQYNKEVFYKKKLNDWSKFYSLEEQNEFIKNADYDNPFNLAELLTTGIIRECVSDFETFTLKNKIGRHGKKDTVDNMLKSSINELVETEEDISFSSFPDSTIPDLEINYNSCPIGTIINKDSQDHSNCVNTSGSDVENSSFNLYRRISTNQLDFSEDEKRLFLIAGNWCLDEDIIYSDSEHEPISIMNSIGKLETSK